MTSDARFVVTATSHVVWDDASPPDVTPWLASRKSRKFMGRQDQLAAIAAGQALEAAGLRRGVVDHDTTGLYLTVGHIPFERDDIDAIAGHSVGADGSFDIVRFAADGIAQVNPLLTFRCLPNMPAFHVSQNFGLTGAYEVAYPGTAQAAMALAHALDDLEDGRVERALVAGVADQRNFLVQFFFDRDPVRRALPRRDEAAMVVIESAAAARARGVEALMGVESIEVTPHRGGREGEGLRAPGLAAAADLFAWLHREASSVHVHSTCSTFVATSLEGSAVRVGVRRCGCDNDRGNGNDHGRSDGRPIEGRR